MRLTSILRAQHLGWVFKKHWQIQGKRIPIDTGAKAVLQNFNIQVADAEEIAKAIPKLPFPRIEFDTSNQLEVENQDINYSSGPKCFVYQDKHVLLEGLTQARILTNTIEITSMPKRIDEFVEKFTGGIPSIVDKTIQDAILASHVYDTEQEKTAIVKIPERPAFVLPRNYGITDDRKSRLTISKLLFECEKLTGKTLTGKRKIIADHDGVNFVTTFNRDECKIQLNLPVQVLMTTDRPIEPFREKYNADLPDIFPLKCTISIPYENELSQQDFYPLAKNVNCSHPHTVITYYSPSNVKNLNETPVTTEQYQARTLLAGFAAAAARAQQLYGESSKNSTSPLPKPIVVQSIQTNGRSFHFGIYQLNTLDLDNTNGIKNYWFHLPQAVNLFEECSYINGRPILQGYNKDVIKYIRAFYQNN